MTLRPTGKVPVVADGDSLYESNFVNGYLDEVLDGPVLLPEDPKEKALARIWMSRADGVLYPHVFVASVGRERGFPEERTSKALKKLKESLSRLEERLERREYLAGGDFSLADVAHAGNFVRLRQLEKEGAVLSRITRTSAPGWRRSRPATSIGSREPGEL